MVELINVNGPTFAYSITGLASASLMIILHGGRGMGMYLHPTVKSTTIWQTNIGDHRSDVRIYSQISSQLRFLSFDYRGHGQSSLIKPYSFEQLVDDIEGIWKHFLGVDEWVIICDVSFGGFLAQQYIIKYALKVSYLILRGTAASHHRTPSLHPVLHLRSSC